MSKAKFIRILFSAFFVTASVGTIAACEKGGGGRKGKSERLRWVNKPTTGSVQKEGKLITIPDLGVDFYVPEVLYVYKDCKEAGHSPEGPDNAWVPVLRCSSPFEDSGEDDWDSEEDDSGGGDQELVIYATPKNDMIINERAVTSYTTQYTQAGFEVDDIQYFDEYLSKPGRRGIEILVHTVNSETGYPDREIRRFMFPKDDVVFIAHIDYPYGDDRSGINSDWERILWNFQFTEDGPLFDL